MYKLSTFGKEVSDAAFDLRLAMYFIDTHAHSQVLNTIALKWERPILLVGSLQF